MTEVANSRRVYLLTSTDGLGHTRIGATFGKTECRVILWTDDKADDKPITLAFDVEPFSFNQRLTLEQARMLANALLAAAQQATGDAS